MHEHVQRAFPISCLHHPMPSDGGVGGKSEPAALPMKARGTRADRITRPKAWRERSDLAARPRDHISNSEARISEQDQPLAARPAPKTAPESRHQCRRSS